MTDALFWTIVGLLDWSVVAKDATGEVPSESLIAVLEPAVRHLAALPVREIYQFDDHLRWRLFTLDTREHAFRFAPGERDRGYVDDETPFSTDGFLDSRALVVAMGRCDYERILADPLQMPRGDFELFMGISGYAYERKTGRDFEYESPIPIYAGANKGGWLRPPA